MEVKIIEAVLPSDNAKVIYIRRKRPQEEFRFRIGSIARLLEVVQIAPVDVHIKFGARNRLDLPS